MCAQAKVYIFAAGVVLVVMFGCDMLLLYG